MIDGNLGEEIRKTRENVSRITKAYRQIREIGFDLYWFGMGGVFRMVALPDRERKPLNAMALEFTPQDERDIFPHLGEIGDIRRVYLDFGLHPLRDIPRMNKFSAYAVEEALAGRMPVVHRSEFLDLNY